MRHRSDDSEIRDDRNILSEKKNDVVDILGMPMNRITIEELLQISDQCIASRKQLLLGVANVAKVVNARKDSLLRQSLDRADLVVADGLPLVWLSRLLGTPLPERIAGIDVMYELLREANDKHYSVYFLGARLEVLQQVVKIVRRDYPGVRVAGYRDGYFAKGEEETVAEEIRDSRADIVFVAISPPKKEIFLNKWRELMAVPICHGVGGSFDVFAGFTRRAPRWMQNSGLEWLYRLIQEPRRMWKRYLVTNTIFLELCLRAVLRARFGRQFHRPANLAAYDAHDPNV